MSFEIQLGSGRNIRMLWSDESDTVNESSLTQLFVPSKFWFFNQINENGGFHFIQMIFDYFPAEKRKKHQHNFRFTNFSSQLFVCHFNFISIQFSVSSYISYYLLVFSNGIYSWNEMARWFCRWKIIWDPENTNLKRFYYILTI